MKNNLFILIFSALTLSSCFCSKNAVEAQDGDSETYGWQKGDWALSGAVNYSSSKQDVEKENSFTFMPRVSNFITPNLELGANLGYMSTKSEFDGETTSEWNTLMAGPFLSYYCMPEKRFSPWASLGVNYQSTNYKSSDYKEDGFGAGLSVGADYWVNRNWALNASVGAAEFSSVKGDFEGAEAQNNFDVGLDFKNVYLGVSYRF